MKDFLILFREPDGRQQIHTPEENQQHQLNWKNWMEQLIRDGSLAGGRPLTLSGKVIYPNGEVKEDIYKNGIEIVGGYLLIKSGNLEQAVTLMKSCPVFERGATAEVREIM